MLESELGSEVENGRLVRLMTKLGFINERAEYVSSLVDGPDKAGVDWNADLVTGSSWIQGGQIPVIGPSFLPSRASSQCQSHIANAPCAVTSSSSSATLCFIQLASTEHPCWTCRTCLPA